MHSSTVYMHAPCALRETIHGEASAPRTALQCSTGHSRSLCPQVEAMKRRDVYIRSQLLDKIRNDTRKARELLSQRAALQDQRKRANMRVPALLIGAAGFGLCIALLLGNQQSTVNVVYGYSQEVTCSV